MAKILSNPFFIYSMSFAVALCTYSLGWSGLYPSLTITLLVFFGITFVMCFFGGAILQKFGKIQYFNIPPSRNRVSILIFIWVGYLAEFAYNRGIPLLLLLRGDTGFEYTEFGIPTFHVLLVTLNGFATVYLFHQLISDFNKTTLIQFILMIIPSVLIMNRGMLLMSLTSCLFVYILSLNRIRFRTLVKISLLCLVLFYVFGLLGNIRQTRGRSFSSDIILDISKSTQEFRDSFVPNVYFWSYLYVSSPLANLQNTINESPPAREEWMPFINYELLPDFISKRTGNLLMVDKRYPVRVEGWLTASTFYSGSYVYLGWSGIVVMYLFFLITTFLYPFILKKDKYYVTGLAILNTLVLYNTFDNMYAFTGLCFQLIYPVLFSYIKIPRVRILTVSPAVSKE